MNQSQTAYAFPREDSIVISDKPLLDVAQASESYVEGVPVEVKA